MKTPDLTLEAGLPANLDAERTILGAILLDNAAHAEAAEAIEPDDFSLDSHRRIFLRMSQLADAGSTIDIVTLSNALSRFKEVEAVGGVAYLASLTEGLPRRPVIEDYIRIVKDKAQLRRLMGICSAAIAKAADQSQDAIGILDETGAQLLEAADSGLKGGLLPIDAIVRGSFASIDKLYEDRRAVTGLATQLYAFDKMTSGLQRGDLIVIAARPSMGKTALAINIAERAALLSGATVAVFSLEMNRASLLRRMLSSQARVAQQRLRAGELSPRDRQALDQALERLVGARIFIDDSASLTLAEMRAKGRRLKQTAGALDLVIVDYLQLMTASQGKRNYENRVQEVSAISRGLKAMAKELDVPVLALSQLSRQNERREDKRPFLSDLRESGSIEQDADLVAFIHRPSYYERDEDLTLEERAKAELIVAKQRNGPTGSIPLYFLCGTVQLLKKPRENPREGRQSESTVNA